MPAPKNNNYACKRKADKKTIRRMVNMTKAQSDRLTKHLKEIDMSWTQWICAVIDQSISDES